MRTVSLVFFALAVLLALPAASAEEGRTAFTLVTHHQGGAYWWSLDGETTKNPELVVPPRANVTITVRNGDGGLHNFQVAGRAASAYVDALDEEVAYSFEAPAAGSVAYWCAPHKSSGMGGVVRVAGSPREDVRESGPAAQLAGVAFALVAAAFAVRRR